VKYVQPDQLLNLNIRLQGIAGELWNGDGFETAKFHKILTFVDKIEKELER
jgi:hypothetical protein